VCDFVIEREGEPVLPDTTTVTVAVTEPDEFDAVRVYVVVAVGFTGIDPDGGTLLKVVMFTVVALFTDQLRVDDPPGDIVVGFAVNDTMVGTGLAGVMVVGSVATTEPVVPPPLAVAVFVNDDGALEAISTFTVIGG